MIYATLFGLLAVALAIYFGAEAIADAIMAAEAARERLINEVESAANP